METPQCGLLLALLPSTGTRCQDLPDLLYSLMLFRRGWQRWTGGIPDAQDLQESALRWEAALGTCLSMAGGSSAANTEHIWGLWPDGHSDPAHPLPWPKPPLMLLLLHLLLLCCTSSWTANEAKPQQAPTSHPITEPPEPGGAFPALQQGGDGPRFVQMSECHSALRDQL